MPKDASVTVWTVEVRHPKSSSALSHEANVIRYTLSDNIWCIESARNAAIRQCISDVDAVICMDADLVFDDTDWWKIVLQSLEKYPVLQGFESGIWLDAAGSASYQRKSLLWGHRQQELKSWPESCEDRFHVGFCWAARRDFWTEGPGIPDWVCFGANDRALALACTNHQHHQWTGWWRARLDAYTTELHRWMGKEKAGYAPLTVRHLWHGDVKNRRYAERSTRLSKVNWPRHCRYNEGGLLSWTDEGHKLHNEWFKQTMLLRQNED